MSKQYYSLLAREPGDANWSIQFGDYDREVVEQERDDIKDGGQAFAKGTKFKVIKTGDKQADIVAAVAKLNEEVK